MTIQRIHDREYQVVYSDQKILRFNIIDKKIDAETSYYLVQKAIKELHDPENLEKYNEVITKRFRYGDKKWKVMRRAGLTWAERLLVFFALYFPPPADRVVQYEINSAYIGANTKKPNSLAVHRNKRRWKKELGHLFFRSNYKRFKADISGKEAYRESVSETLYIEGVRGRVELKNWAAGFQQYRDPYTTLATHAFQTGEKNFSGRDFHDFSSSRFCFILKNEHLELVRRDSKAHVTPENSKAALDAYLGHLVTQYGQEKIDYIDHLYGLDIKNATKLTPEHVYRFNIGSTNIEIQDIEELKRKLIEFNKSTIYLSPDTSFEEIAKDYLPIKHIEAVNRRLDFPTIFQFRVWMQGMLGLRGNVEDLDLGLFNELNQLIYPSADEKQRAYTGRKITQVIQSAYSIAGFKEYKPWIDQQEVTQITEELKECSSWEAYHELLAHVLVKKHLARKHPTEGLRVGALIPAPFNKGWYRVKRFITNQYTHSYELESVCKSDLAPIKLYRSTASSLYAANAHKSIVNNFCQLQCPGYMGIELMKEYEGELFTKRTIPVWVAYQHAAEEMLSNPKADLEQVQSCLTSANLAIFDSEQKAALVKNLGQIMKENDAILNDLFLRFSQVLGYRNGDRSNTYTRLYKRLVEEHIQKDELDIDKQKRHARLLKSLLTKFIGKEEQFSIRDRTLMEKVLRDLESHILSKTPNAEGAAAFELFLANEGNALKDFEGKDTEVELNQWSQALRKIAEARGENLEAKRSEGIDITGHSLGGACAQAGFFKHIIADARVPVPGQKIRIFEFDAPGINDLDNEAIKEFGNIHVGLLNHLKMKFELVRRQEVHDFFPRGGEAHLGATYSTNESAQVQQWLIFNAALNERLSTGSRPEIVESAGFHATRFERGVPHRSFYDRAEEGEAISQLNSDYMRTYYSPETQGIFDSCGKKGGKHAHKIHHYLFYNFWKMPVLFESYVNEDARKQVGSSWMWMRYYLFKNQVDTHQIDSDHLDIHGCCAVDATVGVISAA